MGTRNLTMVIDLEGSTKIAQYGQWDGYPEGQGVTALEFARDRKKMDNLLSNLYKCRFLDKDGKDKDFIDLYNKNAPQWSNEPDKRTDEQKKWWSTFMTRDLGAEILENVSDFNGDEIILDDSSDFIKDSSFCEWAYIIDFKEGLFKVRCGSKKDFELTNLPTKEEFLNHFNEEDSTNAE